MKQSLEIKPCPFCGETKIKTAKKQNCGWYVYCVKCYASSGVEEEDEKEIREEVWIGEAVYKRVRRTGEQKAILAWNRRYAQKKSGEVKTIIVASDEAERMIKDRAALNATARQREEKAE